MKDRGPGPHFLQLVELDKYHTRKDGQLFYNEQPVDRGEMCYFVAPFEAPVYIRWTRVLKNVPASPGMSGEVPALVAQTMEVDCFTFGVKVYVRIGMDGTLKVITEDADGRETVASYTREKA